MRNVARALSLAIAWLLVAGLFVQVFLAGLGVFASPADFITHQNFGYALELLPLLLVVTGLLGRLGRRFVGLAGLIFGLFLLQSVFVGVRVDAPTIAALHPVNGFVILLLSIVEAREVTIVVRPPSGAVAATPSKSTEP